VRPWQKKSDEFFTILDGENSDSGLHEPIIAGGPDAPHWTGIKAARDAGLTREEIVLLYGQKKQRQRSPPKRKRKS